MSTARKIASNNVITISLLKPDLLRAKPPFKPRPINRYSDKNFVKGSGMDKFDRIRPAKIPNRKNKIAGSNKLCIFLLGKYTLKK